MINNIKFCNTLAINFWNIRLSRIVCTYTDISLRKISSSHFPISFFILSYNALYLSNLKAGLLGKSEAVVAGSEDDGNDCVVGNEVEDFGGLNVFEIANAC